MVEENKIEENNCQDENGVEVEEDGDDFTPTTVVIMLGSMNFEPVDSVDILSLKIRDPDERTEVLEKASKNIPPNSLESMHVLLKSSSVSVLFDDSILTLFYDKIMPGKEVAFHVLPESAALADDMAVQAGDVDSIRMGLVTAGLLLTVEEASEGGWVLNAMKPGGEEDCSSEEDEGGEEPTEAGKEEEEEFLKLVNKELETNS